MKDLQHYAEMAEIMLEDLNIPYTKPVRYEVKKMRSWGRCSQKGAEFVIAINSILVKDDTDVKGLINTLIHELLHTVEGCRNHGPKWKRYAGLVYDKKGYNITRTNSFADKGVSENDYIAAHRYVFKCQGCGVIDAYDRQTRFVNYPERYHCGKCGGKFIQIK